MAADIEDGEALPLAFFRYDVAPDGRDGLARIAQALRSRGARLAGVVQHDSPRADRPRCDMRLEDLATGRTLAISADRGAHARGCRLDHAALATAEAWIAQALHDGADALIVNKFGKEEAAGKGLFPTIAEAAINGIPALLGLSALNRDAALRATGDGLREFVAEAGAEAWLFSLRASRLGAFPTTAPTMRQGRGQRS